MSFYIHTHIYVNIYFFVSIYLCTYTHINVRMGTFGYICIYLYIYTHTQGCTCFVHGHTHVDECTDLSDWFCSLEPWWPMQKSGGRGKIGPSVELREVHMQESWHGSLEKDQHRGFCKALEATLRTKGFIIILGEDFKGFNWDLCNFLPIHVLCN